VIVEDVPFEFEQEPAFEEIEPQFLGEEGKWIFPPLHTLFGPNNLHDITL
jgi:hypothetical protein